MTIFFSSSTPFSRTNCSNLSVYALQSSLVASKGSRHPRVKVAILVANVKFWDRYNSTIEKYTLSSSQTQLVKLQITDIKIIQTSRLTDYPQVITKTPSRGYPYLPSGDFELDFRVGLSSWIFEFELDIDIDIDCIINCISCLITNNCDFFVTLYSRRRFST